MISKTFLSMFEDAPPEADTLRFAMKLQPKVQRNAENQACSELVALRRAAHPFIVRLEQAFQTPKFYALLLELCPGGNLNSLICRSFDEGGRCKGLPVYRTALFMGQALLALLHLHSKLGCVYRDMKPDNVLIADDNTAKLADFGLATKVGGRRHMSVVGTLGFLAPELVFGDREPDDESETDGIVDPFKTDAYSFGVTLLVTLLGEDGADLHEDDDKEWLLPRGGSEAEVLQMLQVVFAERSSLPPDGLSLIQALIPHKPRQRSALSDRDIVDHPFFKKVLQCDDLQSFLLGSLT